MIISLQLKLRRIGQLSLTQNVFILFTAACKELDFMGCAAECLCLCVSVIQDGRCKGRRVKTSLQKRQIYSFKAFGYIFTSEVSLLHFLSHSYIPSSPVVLHIPRHFAVFSPSYQSQQRGPEMNPLSCIIQPQSKSLQKEPLPLCMFQQRGSAFV